jgi:predicted dehydrogenase
METNNRRYFLQTSSAAAAAALAPRMSAAARKLDANDRVRVAVIGVRGQGGAHLDQYAEMDKVEIAAICDIDDAMLDKGMKQLAEKNIKPQTFKDVRKILDDQSIDAISIATPNHWHSLMGIWACQAGKDVYVEKPCSHSVWEGRQLVKAARKYNRIVQHGTNSRSGLAIQEAVKRMADGEFGEIYMSRGLCYKWRDTIGRTPDEPVPAGVDYDMWLGPAPDRAFSKNRFHYNWHWNWDYGNGDMGNQGIHEMDIARWGLGVKLPNKVNCTGGHFLFDDDQETPNTLVATFEYNQGAKKKMLVFEVRHWMSNHEAGIGEGGRRKSSNTVGNLFYGSKGYVAIDGYNKYWSYMGREQEPGPERSEGGNNWANFIAAVRERRQDMLNADIEEGHLSCVLVHIANISYRLGRSLEFDPASETFLRDDEANKMLAREYRKPFVVPEKV